MFIIEIVTKTGRLMRHKYETLEEAKEVAAEIFNKTGVVVGVAEDRK